ncbi:hypothetical protein GJ744_001313 [Endocarpon pusillum]|uniref:Protein kinase domain-containing protein n=1 Tax=Endocarpon pusillum TaxID=364733 RepID=A0A8H7ABS9_9EURO|nr:hypothetical protein GJ744_001313 [Endocarpon pusillum]
MYLKKLNAAIRSKNELEMDDVIQEIFGLVAILCQPTFRELAPIPRDQLPRLRLDACLSPETFKLQVVTHGRKSKIIRRDDIAASTFALCGFDMVVVNKNLPNFHPSQIEVLEKVLGTRILKVSVNGQLRCCKMAGQWTHNSIFREVRLLQRILDAEIASSPQLPGLLGLITSKDGGVIGILMNYVQVSPDIPSLGSLNLDSVAKLRRKKWAGQIRSIVQQLHDIGVVWDDAKPGNILIDKRTMYG